MTADELRKRFEAETGESAGKGPDEKPGWNHRYVHWLIALVLSAESKHAEEMEDAIKTNELCRQTITARYNECVRLGAELSSLESRHAEEMREALTKNTREVIEWVAVSGFLTSTKTFTELVDMFLKSKESQ